MTATRPFKASDYPRPGILAEIWDWGIWFDDGNTYHYAHYDSENLTKEQAIKAATLLNEEWVTRGKVWQAYEKKSGYHERILEVVYQIKGVES